MVVATNCNYELVKSLPKMTTRYSWMLRNIW
jgi:hypothetical protein